MNPVAIGVILALASSPSNGPKFFGEKRETFATTSPSVICLSGAVSYEVNRGGKVFKSIWTEQLDPGPYVPEFEDAAGVFFRGYGQPVSAKMSSYKGQAPRYAGGIYLPKDGKAAPQLYWYSDRDNVPRAGLIIDKLIERDMGKIYVAPEIQKADVAQVIRSKVSDRKAGCPIQTSSPGASL